MPHHSVLRPQAGFHATFTTEIFESRSRQECSLHVVYDFPLQVFVDPYELALRQHEFSFVHWGSTNLELPVDALTAADSGLLLNVSVSDPTPDESLTVTVLLPLHSRYGRPSLANIKPAPVEIPAPVVFWACPRTRLGESDPSLARKLPGVLSSFKSPSVTLLLVPPFIPTSQLLHVPVGHLWHLEIVEVWLSIVVSLSFVYLLLASYKTASRRLPQSSKKDS